MSNLTLDSNQSIYKTAIELLENFPYYSQILSFYKNPRREYHGEEHLIYQFDLINKFIPLLPKDVDKNYACMFLLNTSLFHDCYFEYSNGSGINERISAELSYIHLRKINESLAQDVRLTILATQYYSDKTRQIEFSNQSTVPKLSLLFQDIDMHTLQGNTSKDSIEKELSNFGFNEKQILKGREKFLKSISTRIALSDGFYHSPFNELETYFNNDLVSKINT